MRAGRKKMPLKPGHCNTEMPVCVSWGLVAVKSWECAAGGSTQAQPAKHVARPGTCHPFFPSPSDPVCRLLLLLQSRLKVGEHPSFCQTWWCPCARAACHPSSRGRHFPGWSPGLPLWLSCCHSTSTSLPTIKSSKPPNVVPLPVMHESLLEWPSQSFCFPPFHRAWQWGSSSLLDQKNKRCQNLIATYRQIWGHVWLNGKPLAQIVAV